MANSNDPQLTSAIDAFHRGDLEEARRDCAAILSRDPDCHPALHVMGLVQGRSNQPLVAIDFLSRATHLAPREPEYSRNLGIVLNQAGKFQHALRALDTALTLEGSAPTAATHLALGTSLYELGQHLPAAEHFEKAIALEPRNLDAHHNLAIIRGFSGDVEGAIECFKRVVEIEPENPLALAALADAHRERGDMREATRYFDAAVSKQAPDTIRIAAAISLPPIYSCLEELVKCRTRLELGLKELRDQQLTIRAPLAEKATVPFLLPYQGQNDRDIQALLGRIYRQAWIFTQPALNWTDKPRDRLRVGFISAFLREHTIGKITRGFVAQLDRRTFHVTALSLGASQDRVAHRIRADADAFVELPRQIPTAAKLILKQQLDVLIYMDVGMEPVTYFLAMQRLAPVQCVTWGHPETTGVDTLDYYISCESFETASAQDHYTEELVKFKVPPVYYYRPRAPESLRPRSHFGFDESAHLYYCPQTLFKLHPSYDAVIGGILRADPRGRVLIVRAPRENWNRLLQARFARRLADVVDRIVWVDRLPSDMFLNLVAVSDVMLDTFPFGGGTTSLEGLATGTPVVALRGELMRGRFTAAHLDRLDVAETIAATADEYVEIAVRLANDGDFARDIRERIQQNNEILYEDTQAIRELESFLLGLQPGASVG